MRRFIILLAGALAVLTLTAATAAAKPVAKDYTLTLEATPATMTVGDETLLSGTLSATKPETKVDGYAVSINLYSGATCSGEPYYVGSLTTDEDGMYAGTLSLHAVRTYYFTATVDSGPVKDVTSGCVAVTVTLGGETGDDTTPPVVPETPVVPATPSDEAASSYLCWNRDMVDPVAYTDKVADAMWKTGNYFEPQAILGNVVGGTNIGAYHLVCNATKLVQTELAVGGSGEVYTTPTLLYHAEHSGANDLNIYHVWK